MTISISRILFVQLTQYYTQGKFTYMLSFYIHFFFIRVWLRLNITNTHFIIIYYYSATKE